MTRRTLFAALAAPFVVKAALPAPPAAYWTSASFRWANIDPPWPQEEIVKDLSASLAIWNVPLSRQRFGVAFDGALYTYYGWDAAGLKPPAAFGRGAPLWVAPKRLPLLHTGPRS